MFNKKNNHNNTFINYVINEIAEVELIFFEPVDKIENKNDEKKSTFFFDIDDSIIMKQGEFLLLFLNADFSNDNLANKTFFNHFSAKVTPMLKELNTSDELSNFQKKLKNAINVIFEYKSYIENYKEQFRDYISNAQSDMSISKEKYDVTISLDSRITEINKNYKKVNNTLLKDFGYTYDVYSLKSISQLIYIMLKEFTIFKNFPIRECQNCGKFFIAQNRRDEIYCDNLYQDTGKTCKELGRRRAYIRNLEEDPVRLLYRNIKKRKYMRVKRNPDNRKLVKEVELWKEKADIEYKKYKKQEITSEEFEKWLNENDY